MERNNEDNVNLHEVPAASNETARQLIDEPVVSDDTFDTEPKPSKMEKTNSLGKIFQKMRSNNKKDLQLQERPSSAVSKTKGFQKYVRLLWPKGTQSVIEGTSKSDLYEDIAINDDATDTGTVANQNDVK